MLTAKELRDNWVRFFKDKGFFDVSDRSVIPPSSDRSLLFINSGVAAIKSYFCGDTNLPCNRLVSAQRVIRTGDIESIGKSFRHHTYFEMLGNFSVGEISRKEAIDLAWEFLTSVLGIEGNKLYVTVFKEDKESYDVWNKHIPKERIVLGSKETNFWDMGVGPCGPCTEIYFDRGEKHDKRGVELLEKDIDNERFLEIWNLVFSDYLNVDGEITPSPTKNLDTGAGLERLLVVLQNADNSFDTTLFSPIIDYLSSCFEITDRKQLWAPADYLRTTCILLRDGVSFGNKGRSYVLRKIFRRACEDRKLSSGFFEGFLNVISETLDYYDWNEKRRFIIKQMNEEYRLIQRNQEIAHKLIDELLSKYEKEIPALEIFNLVTREGIPSFYLEQEIYEKGRSYSKKEYEKLFEEHKNKSFNENISSAFVKQVPVLVAPAQPTEFDYESFEIESKITCVYVGNEFEILKDIEEINSDFYIVLEKTVVFPLAAGQDADEGYLLLANDRWVPIQASFKAVNGQILHRVSGLSKEEQKRLLNRETVRVICGKEKRRSLSMNHTAEHLIYAILKKLINKEVTRVSGNKREESFTIEVSVPEGIKKEDFDLLKINNELEKAINNSIEVNTSWGTLEEAKSMGIVGKFDEIYEMNKDRLRFVSLGEYGTELCIGTHTKNTNEIESALIVKFGKEQKNTYKFQVVTGRENVAEKLEGFKNEKEYLLFLQNRETIMKQQKLKEQELFNKNKKKLMKELLNKPKEKNMRIVEQEVKVDVAMAVFKEIRGFLKDEIVLLFFKEEEGYRFFIASDGIDLSVLFKALREKGNKCGGNNSFGSGMYIGDNFKEEFLKIVK